MRVSSWWTRARRGQLLWRSLWTVLRRSIWTAWRFRQATSSPTVRQSLAHTPCPSSTLETNTFQAARSSSTLKVLSFSVTDGGGEVLWNWHRTRGHIMVALVSKWLGLDLVDLALSSQTPNLIRLSVLLNLFMDLQHLFQLLIL